MFDEDQTPTTVLHIVTVEVKCPHCQATIARKRAVLEDEELEALVGLLDSLGLGSSCKVTVHGFKGDVQVR